MSDDYITKDDGYSIFNASSGNVMDLWNSKSMKETRLKMLNGERLSNCEKCYFAEDSGLTSMRSTHHYEKYKRQTSSDGSVDIDPTFLELHFGNICNLSCKMCSQMFSHTIGKELLKIGKDDPEFLTWIKKESGLVNNWTGELDKVYDWFKIDKVKKSIFEMVSKKIQKLNIIGGEPTIIPEFFELFEYCDRQNTLGDKDITICTNLTNTNPKLLDWLPRLSSFTIHASVDGLGERNRYIRYPSDWNTIEKSLDFYRQACDKSEKGFISFAPAVQLLNIDQLVDLSKFFEDRSGPRDHFAWISHVRYPLICDYEYAPRSYRNKVADHLQNNVHKLKKEVNVQEILSHAARLMSEHQHDLDNVKNVQNAFVRYNDTQDRFRKNLTWRKLIPDLEKALTESLS